MNEAKSLGMAFRMGMLFGAGVRYSSMAMDKKPEKWITIKGNHIPLDKDGSPMSKTGKRILNTPKQNAKQTKMVDGLPVVGPDDLPEFRTFDLLFSREASFIHKMRQYVKTYIKPVIEALKNPNGMPSNCDQILMGGRQIGELATHLNADKIKVLPYIAEVYRRGTYRCVQDEKHENIKQVVYTQLNIEIDGSVYFVELVTKELGDKSRDGKYIQYGISKADKLTEDSKQKGSLYKLVEIRVSK